MGVEVEAGQQGVIVKHLFEVGHQPISVGGVAVEAAADLVVDATVGHLLQCNLDQFQRTGIVAVMVVTQQEFRTHGLRELGCVAETAVLIVEVGGQGGVSLVKNVHREDAGAFGYLIGLGHLGRQLLGDPVYFAFVGLVCLGDGRDQSGKTGHALAVGGREVGAAIEGLAFRCKKYGHGPTAAAGEHLHRLHVDLVQVGSLLPVYFDADEVLVHHPGDDFVFEGLPLHHMAPMACGITDAQQDRFVLAPSALQRLLTPGIPVHGIIGVLQQVGAGLVD